MDTYVVDVDSNIGFAHRPSYRVGVKVRRVRIQQTRWLRRVLVEGYAIALIASTIEGEMQRFTDEVARFKANIREPELQAIGSRNFVANADWYVSVENGADLSPGKVLAYDANLVGGRTPDVLIPLDALG
jgi:hypothetical protein